MRPDLRLVSQRTFDRHAGTYDTSPMYASIRSSYPFIAEEILQHEFTDCLDIGCGTGALLSTIASARPNVALHGIDLSKQMIEVARERLPADSVLVVGDSETLPFEDNKFGLILCTYSFHHYLHPQRVLSEVKRVLVPNGTFILADLWLPDPLRLVRNLMLPFGRKGDYRIYSEREIRNSASQVGMNAVKWKRIGRRAYLLVARR